LLDDKYWLKTFVHVCMHFMMHRNFMFFALQCTCTEAQWWLVKNRQDKITKHTNMQRACK
jgi:hypothetical protein